MNYYSQLRRKVESQVRKAKDMPEWLAAGVSRHMDRAEYFREAPDAKSAEQRSLSYQRAMHELWCAHDWLHIYIYRDMPERWNFK